MPLSLEELSSTITEIMAGGKFISISGTRSSVVLFIRHPLLREVQAADLYKSEALARAKKDGLPTIAEMEALLYKRGMWTKDKDKELSDINIQLEAQKVLLAKTTKVPANRERIKGVINLLQDKVWGIRKLKEVMLEHTQERRAEEDRLLFLTWACSYNKDASTRFWNTLDDFRREKDIQLRSSVAVQFAIFSVGCPQDVIREVSKSTLWKLRFMAAQKNFGKLFPREIYDYSVDMINLLYWSTFYSSINEMMPEDKPEDNIIEDDAALDAYMEDYFKEQNRKHAEARSKGSKYGKASAWSHEETLVTKANPLHKDIEYSETIAEKLRRKGDTSTTERALESKKK